MSAAYWAPWPAAGDIVDCLFPEEVGTPGPKERPALVLQVEEAADSPGTNPGHPKRGRLDLRDTVTKMKLHSAILEAEQLRRDLDVSD